MQLVRLCPPFTSSRYVRAYQQDKHVRHHQTKHINTQQARNDSSAARMTMSRPGHGQGQEEGERESDGARRRESEIDRQRDRERERERWCGQG